MHASCVRLECSAVLVLLDLKSQTLLAHQVIHFFLDLTVSVVFKGNGERDMRTTPEDGNKHRS